MNQNEETSIEDELVRKGKNAPRLTPDMIDDAIQSTQYHIFSGTTLTVCAITLMNGFVVTGTSAAASPENFDAEIGKRISFNNAREKIWELQGYLLKQRLYETKQTSSV